MRGKSSRDFSSVILVKHFIAFTAQKIPMNRSTSIRFPYSDLNYGHDRRKCGSHDFVCDSSYYDCK